MKPLYIIGLLILSVFIFERTIIDYRIIKQQIQIDTLKYINVTTYQNEVSQTDSRPNETSSSFILYNGAKWHENKKYGYCAVSRDLLFHYFNFYDTISIQVDSMYYKFIIVDTMASDKVNSVDLFSDYTFSFKSQIIYVK